MFKINTTKSSWFLTDPSLVTKSGYKVPQVTADSTVSYLGRRISPWTGLNQGTGERLHGHAPEGQVIGHEHHQKGQLISVCLMSHFLFFLVLALIPITAICRLELELWRVWEESSASSLYCRKRDVGLGIPKPKMITILSLKTGYKFIDGTD
jgi:hypothetical protein